MLTLNYFASLREKLGLESEQLDCPAGANTVAELVDALVATRDPQWRETLCAANVLVAVNQEMVDSDHTFEDGDEIAFFPPVTGG